jgi:uncharacterized RmlC-like cupin family protein
MIKPQKVTPIERVKGDPTKGMAREEAIATDHVWSGLVRTAAGMTSGWHHHGEYETIVYAISGALRLEFGENGQEALEAHAGDFVLIPPGVVHRESNPSNEESHLIVVRSGTGAPTINVEGPAT